MIRVTLDTNTLISGTFWSGDSFRIMNLAENRKIESILSAEIIGEYRKVLESDEIVEKVENKGLIISAVCQRGIMSSKMVDPKRRIKIVKDDHDDDTFIEAAVEGRASYIISSDKHLLNIKEFEGIRIVKPSEFLKIYEKQ